MRKIVRLFACALACTIWLPSSPVFATESAKLHSCAISKNKVTDRNFDLVVVGGTPSGVAASVSAASRGLKVLLLSQSTLVGGAISNGLGATDVGSWMAVSGYPRYFYGLVSRFYKSDSAWRTEPKVAESIFTAELLLHGVTVRKQSVVSSVQISKDQITGITLRSGEKYCGRVFIDATYTGDLLALAGARFHLSDSDLLSYSEPQVRNPKLDLILEFKGRAKDVISREFAANPYIRSFSKNPTFANTYKLGMPSMTYRLCITKRKSNLVKFSAGVNYQKWVSSWRTFMKNYFNSSHPATYSIHGNGSIVTRLWQIAKLPNDKYDMNSGRSSFTNIPIPKTYFFDPTQREKISASFAEYLQDFIYFNQHDPSVPRQERKAVEGFGLCADEFVTHHNWPLEPYLRGGRRLLGKTTVTTNDIFLNREKPDSVAIGSYRLDMKPGMFIYSDGKLFQDWSTFFKAPIYEIPFRAMLPKQGITNLIVSVSISSSPLAFSSLRMEVQFMSLGEAAGIASALAVHKNQAISLRLVHGVQVELRKVGALFRIRDVCTLMDQNERKSEHFKERTCIPIKVYLSPSDFSTPKKKISSRQK